MEIIDGAGRQRNGLIMHAKKGNGDFGQCGRWQAFYKQGL